MGIFDFLKKKTVVSQDTPKKDNTLTTQSQIYTCVKCKKEIMDEESKWIGDYRFCVDCATQPLNNEPKKQDKHSNYEKKKRICLCHHKKDEYEWYQMELQFNENDEILIVDTYYWPALRGASNGGQNTIKLDADYFSKNSIDDFIVFLKNKYKLAKDFNQDFSHLKNRDDINTLFRKKNAIIFKMITKEGESYNFTYLYHTRYSPNRSTTCGYGSDDWYYLCKDKDSYYLLEFTDNPSYGTAWTCVELLDGDYEKLVEEDVTFWEQIAYSKERKQTYGLKLPDIDAVRELLPTYSRCNKFNDAHYTG